MTGLLAAGWACAGFSADLGDSVMRNQSFLLQFVEDQLDTRFHISPSTTVLMLLLEPNEVGVAVGFHELLEVVEGEGC